MPSLFRPHGSFSAAILGCNYPEIPDAQKAVYDVEKRRYLNQNNINNTSRFFLKVFDLLF